MVQKVIQFPKQKTIIVSRFSETDRVKMAQELGLAAMSRSPTFGGRSVWPSGENWIDREIEF